MNLVDSHSHLFLEDFADDLELVIERARSAGITHIFMPNIDSTTVEPMLRVCTKYKGYCFPMIGLHPTSVFGGYSSELEVVREQLERNKCYVAIGEIGMDLYWDKTFLKEQELVFNRQLEWALEYNLPVVIHCREAFEHVYAAVNLYKNELCGIFHSFMGTVEEAARLLEFSNFYLGINGVVTFKKSELPNILSSIPLDKIVLETDAPYLSPVPYRGKRNESAYMKKTLEKVSEIYALPEEKVACVTSENALKVFGMLK